MSKLKIEIYSDLICPWCYIGKRRMQAGLKLFGSDFATEIIWRPFQLNPEMPSEGMDRKTYRSRKFGSWERSQAMDDNVASIGRSIGIGFHYDRVLVTPNTMAGHRMLWWAEQRKRQHHLAEALFHGMSAQLRRRPWGKPNTRVTSRKVDPGFGRNLVTGGVPGGLP
jgi:predicted DsbA family dithiol-disulfide isomerase